jgi:hypothetical protein
MVEAIKSNSRFENWKSDFGGKLRAAAEGYGLITSKREVAWQSYLESLDETDRKHVLKFTAFMEELAETLPFPIGITAVGSTTRPERLRLSPIDDIDLRILNGEVELADRLKASELLRSEIRGYLEKSGCIFLELDSTTTVHRIKQGADLIPFADFYNNDPSFLVLFKDSLPLHLSISGYDNPPLGDYLTSERKSNSHFSLLFISGPVEEQHKLKE